MNTVKINLPFAQMFLSARTLVVSIFFLSLIPLIYSCLLCRMCEEYCPAEVHIVENILYLRRYINEEEFKLL